MSGDETLDPVCARSDGADPAADDRRAVLDAEQTVADALQRASDTAQIAADAEQTDADEARERSDRARYLSDADQRTSDRDQAIADLKDGPTDNAGQRARDADRHLREQTSAGRAKDTITREQAAIDRFAQAEARDQAARLRDRASIARDREASARDTESGIDEPGEAAELRRSATDDRLRAADDRLRAADDREQNSVDRNELRLALARRQFDDLTGTYRRGPGNRVLQAELDRAQRSDTPLVLAFVDVDDLKLHNDVNGHQAGDMLLLDVVDCIRRHLRTYDPVIRFGGDEFVCALAGADLREAQGRFRTISAALEDLRPGASISVGLARAQSNETLDALIARGDTALYAVKHGRTRLVGPPSGSSSGTDRLDDPITSPSRVAAVRQLGSLRGNMQIGVSRLNRVAVQILGAPMSATWILDDVRHVVIGHAGLGPAHGLDERSVSGGYCREVVRTGAALTIDDVRVRPPAGHEGAPEACEMLAYAGLPLRLATGEVVGAFCAMANAPRAWSQQDLATLEELAALAVDQLEYRRASVALGTTDPVTGLPRLAQFSQHLEALLRERVEADAVTLVAADLAGFRLLNDAWGYQTGDAVLAEIARRLESIAAQYGNGGSVCRINGDTFLVAASIASTARRDALVAYVRRAITDRPVEIAGREQPVDGRVSLVTSRAGTTASGLITTAAAATEQALLFGRTSEKSDSLTAVVARQRLQIRNALSGAELRGELSLNYQPLMDLATGNVRGFEALLRWNHPELGSVPPDDFIPLAESSGAIEPIGHWVLTTALTALADWRATPAGADLTMAVNVAPEQLTSAFAGRVEQALAFAGVPADALTLEITERTLLANRAATRHTFDELRNLGVQLSLDDFGTGLSSLARLASFSLDELKLDRAFVADLVEGPRQASLVAGILAMAHALGVLVVAEGIETEEQRSMLTNMGCAIGQGFLLGRPMPAADVPAVLGGLVHR